jgi:hypothetical protein
VLKAPCDWHQMVIANHLFEVAPVTKASNSDPRRDLTV